MCRNKTERTAPQKKRKINVTSRERLTVRKWKAGGLRSQFFKRLALFSKPFVTACVKLPGLISVINITGGKIQSSGPVRFLFGRKIYSSRFKLYSDDSSAIWNKRLSLPLPLSRTLSDWHLKTINLRFVMRQRQRGANQILDALQL